MNVLNWFFFIVASVGYILSILGTVYNLDEEDEDNVILFNFLNIVTIGLVFYTSLSIFISSVTIIILWSILGIAIILSIYTIYKFILDDNTVQIIYKIVSIFLLISLIFIVFMSFNLKIYSAKLGVDVSNSYKSVIPIIEIILVFWVPLLVVLFIYWNIKTKLNSKTIEESQYYGDNEIEELIHRLYYLFKDFSNSDKQNGMIFEEAEMYLRKYDVRPEIRHTILRNITKLVSNRRMQKSIYSLSEFKNLILYGFNDQFEVDNYSFENTYFLENITERIQTILKKEFGNFMNVNKYEINSISSVKDNINEIKLLLNKQALLDVNEKKEISINSNISSSQQQFIKELFHCLMTPISQVDASLSTIKAKLPQKDEVLERSMKAIKAGIELTKAVLFAYRQVAFFTYNNTNDDTLSIKEGISSAELLYQSHSKKNIDFKDINIPDSILGFSNYFTLAAILPLLENAICATEPEQLITIEYCNTLHHHIFRISNPINNPVNINNLYKDGFSSKNEKGKPHKGTGLSIVRNLISNIEQSSLDYEMNDNTLTASLKIYNNGN
jgi:hypothetical protein